MERTAKANGSLGYSCTLYSGGSPCLDALTMGNRIVLGL